MTTVTTVRAPALEGTLSSSEVAATVASIAACQRPDGAIPWYPGGRTDPWDHVECAMALDAGRQHRAAEQAYRWLALTQRPDGSWASSYRGGRVVDATGETHHAAYVALGVWHHVLATGDDHFLDTMWPTVRRALDWVVTMQGPEGQLWWARSPTGAVDQVALVTASASAHHGLLAGLAIASRLGVSVPHWQQAVAGLRHAWAAHPQTFAQRGRYSMDWYYPLLGGLLSGAAAWSRIQAGWDEFVLSGLGVRCVSDRPWVTGAETCELALSLQACGRPSLAAELVTAIQHLRHEDGAYWTGLVVDDGVRWPVERTTWTGAAMVLAVDALAATGPHSQVFCTGRDDLGCNDEAFGPGQGSQVADGSATAGASPSFPGEWACPSCEAAAATRILHVR